MSQDTSKWYTVITEAEFHQFMRHGPSRESVGALMGRPNLVGDKIPLSNFFDFFTKRELEWLLNSEPYDIKTHHSGKKWIHRWTALDLTKNQRVLLGLHPSLKYGADWYKKVMWPLQRELTLESFFGPTSDEVITELSINKYKDDWFFLTIEYVSSTQLKFLNFNTPFILKCDGFVGLRRALYDYKMIK